MRANIEILSRGTLVGPLCFRPEAGRLGTIAPPRWKALDVTPQASSRKRNLVIEVLYFNAAELSEINILFLDRVPDTWKAVFNAFALAVAMSVLAATISSLTQSSKRST